MHLKERVKLLHHLGIAVGFLTLILWYVVADHLGLTLWLSLLAPESHRGAGLMVAIMLIMTPAFFLWKGFNRWVERKLEIKGKYYEDEYYADEHYKSENNKNGSD